MKTNYLTTALIAFVFSALLGINTNAQSFASASEYMAFMGEQYKQISKDTWDYTSAVARDKRARKIENKRQDLLKSNLSAQKKISKLPDFEGNTSYRDSVVRYLELSYAVLNHDYEKIMDMEEIAEQSYDLMEAYLKAQEEAGRKMKEAGDMLDNEQQKFADEFDINLIEGKKSKTGERLEQAGKMWDYYNEIYLIFFKCYKQEVFMLDAMGAGDINAMEQNKAALISYSDEGLEKLKSVKSFDGDGSLKAACRDILEFYKEEAEEKFPIIIDFFLKKENFEKMEKAMNEKKKRDRTQEDIDKYNEAVNSYNASIETYNKTNDELNKRRDDALDDWNKTSKRFTRKNVK